MYLYHLLVHARSTNPADGDNLVFRKRVHTYTFYRVTIPNSIKRMPCLVSLVKRQRISSIYAATSWASRRHLLLICVLRPWRSVWIMMCHKDGSPNIDLSRSARQHVVCREAAHLSHKTWQHVIPYFHLSVYLIHKTTQDGGKVVIVCQPNTSPLLSK